ncbi:uncharacterized protein PV09_04793 [Verruconis gallopava]|uniref:Protein HRI1 n=1 Tax=Verruconis gallopava TaxID=253628 RepID=A0A0D1YTI1_9PEZI|nr:uncharacterized protein PV09_04793 [Verruconis gallopava]KIW03957.1 hypothetical protein PV09_04793 [Verruconis gallopava]
MASISHRYSIRWLPDEASEPTSTLVLTSGTGYYTDIRIRHGTGGAPPSCLPASEDRMLRPRRGEIHQLTSYELVSDAALDWAFAGRSSSTAGSPRKCTWDHWVDSRTSLLDETPVADSGWMHPQEDGKSLEKGSMVNPETGRETDYEEVWEDVALAYPANLEYDRYVLTLDSGEDGVERSRERGVAVQLGAWFQTIQRRDWFDEDGMARTDLAVSRWKWDEECGRWNIVVGAGNKTSIPPYVIEKAMREAKVRDSGDIVDINSQTWLCRELSRKNAD